MIATLLLTAVAGYFLGCFNGAVIVSKYILRDDVRTHGSGNAGLTNFFRTFGGPLTFLVILLDVLKAVLAVLIGAHFFSLVLNAPVLGKYWAGLSCILGHMFPCMFGFKGGKGILSGGVVAIMIDWRLAVVVWGGFILLTALTRYVSLGSCFAAAMFPVMTWVIYRDLPVTALGTVFGVLVLWKHRENIKRIIHGNENKLSFHKKS